MGSDSLPHKPEEMQKGAASASEQTASPFEDLRKKMSSRPEPKTPQPDYEDPTRGKSESQWIEDSRASARKELFPKADKNAPISSEQVLNAMGKESYQTLKSLDQTIEDEVKNHGDRKDIEDKKGMKAEMLQEMHLTTDGKSIDNLSPEIVTKALIKAMADRENISIKDLDHLSAEAKEARLKKIEDGNYAKYYNDVKDHKPMKPDVD